jgi:two-component system chemotaxis sensor kinase CheA
MSGGDDQFVLTFIDEAVDMLDKWEASLQLEAESNCDIDALFRCAHNLKGSSRSVGLDSFGEAVHQIEDVIQQVRAGRMNADEAFLQAMLESKNFLKVWVHKLKNDVHFVADSAALIKLLREISTDQDAGNSVSGNDQGFGFFDDEPTAKVARDLGSILIEKGVVTPIQVEAAAKAQTRRIGEILVEHGAATKEQVEAGLVAQKKMGAEPDETIRVSVKKLDQLMRMIGELSIQLSIAKHASQMNSSTSNPKCIEALEASEKISKELRGNLLETRMQSLSGLFHRLNKIAVDVSKQLNKKVEIEFVGGETELDKIVIERVKDPLVHIIRNAVDHGIESEDKRISAGKSAIGQVRIEARQMTNCVEIHISDDGGGIPRKKVFAKAVERGLIQANANLSDDEIQNLIFLPGFSTAEKVTDVSGRGVGMDVVRSSVSELNGSVKIQSHEGKGSRFIVSLPSSVAIIEALVVESAGCSAIVPLTEIEEVLVSEEVRIQKDAAGNQIMTCRDQTTPLVRLTDAIMRFNQDSQKTDVALTDKANGVSRSILVGKSDNGSVGFEIDRIVGQQTIVVRSLQSGMEKLKCYEGATILGSGMPCLIVNIKDLADQTLDSNGDEKGRAYV